MRPHERLDVWKESIDLVVEVYRITASFPKEEMYGLTAQMRRATTSVPANIAEGCARKGMKEQDQFFFIARGSLSELETHLLIALRLSYLREPPFAALKERCDRIAAMLDGLIRRRGAPK